MDLATFISSLLSPFPNSTWGSRQDGSAKGTGFLGAVKASDGSTMTELSVGVDGVEMPLLVPTLTPEEVFYLRMGGAPTAGIISKAVVHANSRNKAKLGAFKELGEK